MHIRHSRESGNPLSGDKQTCAGRWIPAFAGMTGPRIFAFAEPHFQTVGWDERSDAQHRSTNLLSNTIDVRRWASLCSAQPTSDEAEIQLRFDDERRAVQSNTTSPCNISRAMLMTSCQSRSSSTSFAASCLSMPLMMRSSSTSVSMPSVICDARCTVPA